MPLLATETRLLREGLHAEPDLDVRWFDVLDSTNTTALELLESGVRPPLAVLARDQQAGRGRHGRTWLGNEGSLYLTWAPPSRPTLLPAPFYAMASGLALHDVLHREGVRARLKWPNDLLVGPAKLAGILVESRQVLRGPPALVIGIGVNVNQEVDGLPRPLHVETTSLRVASGRSTSLPRLAAAILDALARGLDRMACDPDESFESYRRALALDAVPVEIEVRGQLLVGTLEALDPGRGAIVRTADGERALPLEIISRLRPRDGF